MNECINDKCVCIICGSWLSKDSYRLKIRNFNICSSCEENLVALRVADDRYEIYKEQLKKIWLA